MQTRRNDSNRRLIPIPAAAMLFVGTLVMIFGLIATSCSGDDTSIDDRGDATSRDDTIGPDGSSGTAVSEQDMREALADAMPTLDQSLLEVPSSNNWADSITFSWVFSAMGDTMVNYDDPDLPPEDAERVGDENKVVRIDRERGRIKYLSRERQWGPEGAPGTLPIEPTAALTRIEGMMSNLEMPTGEAGDASTDTEIIGAGNGEGMESTWETYHLVHIPRMINELPVLNSGIQAAITTNDNEPEIQRALIKWPQFQLVPNAVLRDRQDVLDEATQRAMERVPLQDADQNLQVELVYAPAEEPIGDGQIGFLPAVQVKLLSPPTPYIVTVPVASQ